jgi:uncharacterized membrane protein YhaH (DUF805 family)
METNDPYQAPGAAVYDVTAEGTDETNPLSPSGRFGRLSYLAWTTVMNILTMIVMIVVAGGMAGMQEQAMTGGALIMVLQLVALVFLILFTIRRFHDINASGWWSILVVVPIVNLITILVLILKAGAIGANDYGPPRITRTWEKVLGYIAIGLMILSLVGIIVAILLPAFMA